MNHLQENCKSERLNECLEQGAPDQLPADLEQHLAECETCQKELEMRAADPDFWDEAAHLLSTDDTTDRMDVVGINQSGGRLSIPGLIDLLAPTDDPNMLGRLGEYEISGVIGVGGMGAVLKGYDRSLHRVVAIKVMAPHLAHCGSAKNRFQREARAAAAITHDNVIDIYRVADTNGIPYLVMPFARGQSLQKRIDDSGPLSAIEVLRIGRQIAGGLSAAHEQGLVHRDIKPANVLLSDGIERLVITDFGVARAIDDASMTQTGLIAGTPQYMSPEQARGELVDCRSDLFSLGAVLYTACTGRPPFRADAAYGILRRITDSDPRPIQEINPDIPGWLCCLIERLLAKHPSDRFQSAHEVSELFEKCIAHLQQPTEVALPPSIAGLAKESKQDAPNPYLKSSKRSRTLVYSLVATAVVIGGLLLGFFSLTAPPDIAGNWSGEVWDDIYLQSVKGSNHWYSGKFIDEENSEGVIHLEWSRVQRRYKGRWQTNNGLAGSLTLRTGKVKSLRGAMSVDSEFNGYSTISKLRDFEWHKGEGKRKRAAETRNSNLTWESKVDDSLLNQANQIFKAENGRDPSSDELKKMFNPSFLNDLGIATDLADNVINSNVFGGKPKRWTKIIAPTGGVVTYVNDKVAKNAMIKKGTILVQLQSTSDEKIGQQESRREELEKKRAASKAKSEAYASNVKSFTVAAEFAKQTDKAQLDASKGKLKTLESKLQLYRDTLTTAEKDFENINKLAKTGVVSTTEVENQKQKIKLAQINLTASENDISVQKKEIDALQASFRERDALNQTKIDSAKALYQEELSKMATLDKEVQDVKAQLSKFQRIGIAAPRDGKINYWFSKLKKGESVNAGDVLIVLHPEDENGKNDPNSRSNRVPNRNRGTAPGGNLNQSGLNPNNQMQAAPDSNSLDRVSGNFRSVNSGLFDLGSNGGALSAYGDLGASFESISRIRKEIREARTKDADMEKKINSSAYNINRLQGEINRLKNELKELKDGKSVPKSPVNTIQYKEALIKKRESDLRAMSNALDSAKNDRTKQQTLVDDLVKELETFKLLLTTKYQNADNNLKLQKKMVDQVVMRFKNGVVSADEVSKVEQAYNEGLSRTEQLKILLKFCEEEATKSKPKPKSAESKGPKPRETRKSGR